MGWNNTVFPLLIITPTGGFTGLFVYSPGPGPGNLIASITSAAGTDPYGNTFQAGITEYVTISSTRWGVTLAQSVAAFGGTLAGLSIANLSIPWATPASVSGLETGGGANLELSSGLQTAGGTQSAVILRDSVAGGTTGGLIVANAGNFTVQTPVTGLGLNQGIKVLNDANGVAQCQVEYLVAENQGTAPPAMSGAAVLYADGSGFPRFKADSASGDTTAYQIGHATQFNTSDQLINSTTFATVCGTAPAVGIGTYRVHAEITAVQGPNANPNDYRLGFTGTISQVRMKMVSGQDATNMFLATTTSNNGLLPTHGWAAGSTYTATFHGIIVTTSTGTLSIQAAMDAAGDTFTVLALSDFHLEPVN